MFNAGRLRFHLMSVIVTSAIVASVGSSSMAGEPQETVIVRRQAGHTIQILHSDGTTTKLPPGSRTSPASSKHESVAEKAAEAENENATPPSNAGPPAGRPITPLSQSAQRHQPQPRFQVSAAGDSAVLLDTVSGRTWLLYYPDKKILSRLNEERGRTWKEMPCIWLPLHRPEADAEIEQILARERSLREASDKLRAEEQRKSGATSQELLEKLKAERAEQRKRAAGSDGTRRNADGTPQEPKPE